MLPFSEKALPMAITSRVLIGLVLLATVMAWGQASVNESAEKAYVYVDGTKGSDSNSGTQTKPFKTLTKAVSVASANNQKSVGTRVIINPGTYRESLTLNGTSERYAPITLEAATKGTVTVSGADVWGGWTAYGTQKQIYQHSWPYSWGTCTDPAVTQPQQPIVLRREMIFVNGKHLTQVLSFNQMVQGTFYVNETNHTVYLWPASGTNVGSSTIEVSVRPQLFTADNDGNIVIRGINFQYSNGCRSVQPAVEFSSSHEILLDSDSINWNNGMGVRFCSSTNITAENSESNHNGEVGWATYELKYGAWNSDEGSYNNWRGPQGASYALTTEGGDFLLTHNSSFTGMKTLFNLAHGMHLDTDTMDVTVNSLLSAQNFRSGMVIEASEGPVTIEYGNICDNNLQNSSANGAITLTDASEVNLVGNTLYGNLVGQIEIAGRTGGISVTNWETGHVYQVFNEFANINSNTIVGTGAQQVFDDGFLTKDWPLFASTLTSNANKWWNPNTGSAFSVPVPVGHTTMDFTGWKELTKEDAHSTFSSADPPSACVVAPDAADYWFVINNPSATINPGGTATFSVSVIPLAFTGSVSLRADVSQLPKGRASFSPTSITTSGSATVSVSTSSTTKAGTYPVTLIANNGSMTRTITISVVVQ